MDDLDQISKLEIGEQLLLFEDFVIQDLIRDVYETLYIKTKEKDIRCIIKKDVKCRFTYMPIRKRSGRC